MKKIKLFFLLYLFLVLLITSCREDFGDDTQPTLIVQPPVEGSTIVVIEPVRSSIWNPGDTITIKWSAPTINRIKIQLYRKTNYQFTIVDNLNNTGTFSWVVPFEIPYSVHYLVKVSNHNKSDAYAFSSQFAILN